MTRFYRVLNSLAPVRLHSGLRLLFAIACLFFALPLHASSFTASLDRDTVVLGDTVSLSLTFEGGRPGGSPALPNLPGIQVVSSSQSSQFSFGSSGSSSTITHTFVLKPAHVGEYTIPAMTMKVGSETLTSRPVQFKVTRAQTPVPGSEEEQQQLALLRLVLPKKEYYIGEIFVMEMQLLIRSGVQGIGGVDLPGAQSPLTVEGCTPGKCVQGQQRQTVIGSTAYTVVPFYLPLTVMKSGPVVIGPLDGAVIVQLPSRGGQRDPFDPFGMFNHGAQQRIALSAPAETVTALPLPEEGKPASFSGAVGLYQMAVSAGPTNVAVGDPITIRVQIAGRGALDAFSLPEQAAWSEFKTYPPTVKTEVSGNLAIEGTKSFEQVVIPQNTEIKELPAFEFSFFNPDSRRYETLQHPPTPLIVRPGGSAPSPSVALPGVGHETEKPAQDIVHIKPRLGRFQPLAAPWINRPWFLVLQSVPFLALLGATVWRRRREALANNPRLRRRMGVARVVSEGLEQLHRLAVERNSNEFFAVVFHLIQEQIGERLDLPASAITEAIVDEKLQARGLDDATRHTLHELFQQCDQARYAQVESTHELEAFIPKLEAALAGLQEVTG